MIRKRLEEMLGVETGDKRGLIREYVRIQFMPCDVLFAWMHQEKFSRWKWWSGFINAVIMIMTDMATKSNALWDVHFIVLYTCLNAQNSALLDGGYTII